MRQSRHFIRENADTAEYDGGEMIKRIITSLAALCVLVPVLIFSDTVVFPIAVAIVSVISLFEMYRCIGNNKKLSLCVPLYIFALVFPFVMRYAESGEVRSVIAFVCGALILLYLFFLSVNSRGKMKFAEVGEHYTLSLYIITALNGIIYIRDIEGSGKYLYILIFIGAWVTDIFAYFTGMLFGKHKLIPEVSPKKTVEGSIGGTLFCAGAFLLFGVILEAIFELDANYFVLAISGIVVAVVSQIGDLIMSVIKREHGVKDYGNIFPGHGGMLDRFDSILAVSLALSAICFLLRLIGIDLV